MERVAIGDWCTLYHADSVEIIDTLKAHEPDALLADPPYTIPSVAGVTNGYVVRSLGDLNLVEAGLRAIFEPLIECVRSHGRAFCFH